MIALERNVNFTGQESAVAATASSIVPTFTVPSLSLVSPVAEWAADVADPTILVADDDEGVRDLVAYKLSAAGYNAITAGDGTSALTMVHREQPDMVILDVAMPGLDGLSVCYELHSSAATAQIPVLMLSGRDRQVDIDLGLTVGADDYLVKPFSPAELIRRVRWLLLANGD
ncbi:response regulator [Actinoplanes sp. NPDC026619]|uniref:response regulator transcription factor n=1 Tax=Actinoplanes sp. NPDC026619 TaxID=3155798 RepID=UPI0033CD3BAB